MHRPFACAGQEAPGRDGVNWMGTDPTKRAFFRDFRDVNHQNDLGIG